MEEPSLFAVMFADVSGSTALYDEVGDHVASAAVADAVARMSRAVGWHNGVVVKTIGDEVMARFANPVDAALSAVAMLESMVAPVSTGHLLSLRIGVHYGPALLREDGDIFGDAVNVAARVAGVARAGQIILSGAAAALLPQPGPVKVRMLDRLPVKGKKEPLELYQVLWEGDANITSIAGLGGGFGTGPIGVLNLMFRGRTTQVAPGRGPFVLGRDDTSDIQVDSPLVSRTHARIEFRRGRVFLVDESTNGTYVQPQGTAQVRLHREELPLLAAGTISLGQPVVAGDPDVLSYTYLGPRA